MSPAETLTSFAPNFAPIAELRGDLFGLRADFRGELNAAITGQTRAIVFSTVGSVAAVTGIVLGLA